MSKWRVEKVVRLTGKAPFDKWYLDLTEEDKANVDDAILLIEGVTILPPEKVKKYNKLYEVKIYGNKTALRPLAIKDGDHKLIILLVGSTKKGKIPLHIYEAALSLAKEYEDGKLKARGYWED